MTDGPVSITDVALVRSLLVDAARQGTALSYSELLGMLGHRFTRPKMRALCRTLDTIDQEGAAAGEPELAVLVVRESDRLPGQGWWQGMHLLATGYDGPWQGPQAREIVSKLQQATFDFWNNTRPTANK